MSHEDQDVVTQAEFVELRTVVGGIKEAVQDVKLLQQQQTAVLNTLSNNLVELTAIKNVLDKQLNNTDIKDVWTTVNQQGLDINEAHSAIRAEEKSKVRVTAVLVFCFALVQGGAAWYFKGFTDRANRDHDLLMQTVTTLTQLQSDYYYEKRLTLSKLHKSSGYPRVSPLQ